MRKTEDWYLEAGSGHRDELREMKKETPLIAYQMTRDELRIAYRTAKRVIWEQQIKQWKSIILLISIILVGIFLFATMLSPSSITTNIEAGLIVAGICLIPIVLMSLGQIYRVNKNPWIYISYSGALFLGKLYSFHTETEHLISALFIEGDGIDPSLLRLNFGIKAKPPIEETEDTDETVEQEADPNEIMLDIPLRQEHIDRIDDIINTLMSQPTQK